MLFHIEEKNNVTDILEQSASVEKEISIPSGKRLTNAFYTLKINFFNYFLCKIFRAMDYLSYGFEISNILLLK